MKIHSYRYYNFIRIKIKLYELIFKFWEFRSSNYPISILNNNILNKREKKKWFLGHRDIRSGGFQVQQCEHDCVPSCGPRGTKGGRSSETDGTFPADWPRYPQQNRSYPGWWKVQVTSRCICSTAGSRYRSQNSLYPGPLKWKTVFYISIERSRANFDKE